MLEVKNVSVSYGNETIVDNISFAIQPKETVSIVGESGSGKSTLLKAIIGLLGDSGWISGGTITFDGINLASLKDDEMRKIRGAQIATVYQQAGRSMDPITKIGKQFYEAMVTKKKNHQKGITAVCHILYESTLNKKSGSNNKLIPSYTQRWNKSARCPCPGNGNES